VKRRFDPAEPELMDRPQPVSRELREDLHNLYQLNRWFGSHHLLRQFLQNRVAGAGKKSLRVLDLATGYADLPRELVLWARRQGIEITVDAVDFQPATLEIAAEASREFPEIRFRQANLLSFQSEEKWDLVMCHLALHHFPASDATAILALCRRLSCRWVLVSDLLRVPEAAWGIYLITATIFRAPMTRHDARVSIQRAFDLREMETMAREAGWVGFDHRRAGLARQVLQWEIPREKLSPGNSCS